MSCRSTGRSQPPARAPRNGGQQTHLVELLGKEGDRVKVVDALLLEPLLDLADRLIGVVGRREEAAGLEDAAVLYVEAPEDLGEGGLVHEKKGSELAVERGTHPDRERTLYSCMSLTAVSVNSQPRLSLRE